VTLDDVDGGVIHILSNETPLPEVEAVFRAL
jgi:hypothetical protein